MRSPHPLTSAGHLLLTGAAGQLTQVLRGALGSLCQEEGFSGIRLSDRQALPGALDRHEQFIRCDLSDGAAMQALLRDVSAVVHLGGEAGEGPFEPILEANVRGVYHLYEAARLAGTRRVVLASSNHVTGCYPQGERLDPCIHRPRPDGFYGVSKLFGEHMAQLYWDRCGIETVNLRLGTVAEAPQDRRALSTWLSHGDFARLVLACLRAPRVGCLTVYGVSGNAARWWTDSGWQTLGYAPQDSADPWQPMLQDLAPPEDTPMAWLQGGSFLSLGEFSHAVAGHDAGVPAPRLAAKE